MNIRHRIILLVVLSLTAMLSIGGYAALQSRWNASEVRIVTEGIVPSALASADLVAHLKDVQLTTMELVSAPDAKLALQTEDKLKTDKAALKEAIEQQGAQATSDTQRGLVVQAKESLDNYFAAIDDATRFKLSGQKEMAEAALFGAVGEYQREIQSVVETLRIEKNRSKDGAITALNDSLAQTVTGISAAALTALAILAAVGGMLYRQVVRPIGRMQSMMTEIATSQDFSRRLPVEREDEIGRSIVAFNTMLAKIEESSAQLRQKTADIQTMLQNMPQGILTIADGNRVHPEYSAYLESIFETQDIAGRDMMELVFSGTNLGSDLLSQIEAVGGACIGEDAMNFEFNAHLLPGEIEKTLADGKVKILDLNWSPITDADGNTVRLLLCVRDVTELRKLAAEANEQKRELEIIGEILAVSQEKFHEFIAGALKFVDENEALIRQRDEAQTGTVDRLFRNMHTIKGNARTYGLLHLTNLVHEAEQTYEALRGTRPAIAWDQEQLLEELNGVRAEVERYARINEVSLGRKGPGRRGGVERYLMVDREQIQHTLQRLETVNTGNMRELVAARDEVHRVLRLLGTESISHVLSGIFDSLPSLARELGKVVPMVSIDDNGYVVRSQAGSLLKNVFMHLIRNAVDHGLETVDERIAAGKPLAGLISLDASVRDGQFQLALRDDGRGLALARIRRIAVNKGLIGEDAQLDDVTTARLIFQAGFSTASHVTEVSGRGVGMDAVLDFVKREHGRIEIMFLDDAEGADFRQFQIVVSLPDSFAVRVDTGPDARDAELPAADKALQAAV
ncbi:MAG: HAMP domain-containing protein [Proteobacteria bacterium]|nr:HAMP domain-containing protein [Pseudomonadota bacterium]